MPDRGMAWLAACAGLTLVELMVVITIIGIILAIAVMNIKQWSDKYTVESYTKEIYSTLMKARNAAATSNIQVQVTLAANQVDTFHDIDNDGVADAGETTTKPYPQFTIQFTASPVTFDRRGITSDMQTISITDYPPSASPGVDCLVISRARINMGKMTGLTCEQQ